MNGVTNQQMPLILLGAGGHAKVLLSLIKALHLPVLGVSAPELENTGVDFWRGIKVLSNNEVKEKNPTTVALVNAVGRRVGDSNPRQKIFETFKLLGHSFPVLIHPQAYVDPTAIVNEGVQIMAGSMIQADACIGQNVIINTRAVVEHDCIIEEHVHIAPGAVLCGKVHVAKGAFVACGANLSQGIHIGEGAVIGAGVSIVRNVAREQLVLPASLRYSNLIQICGNEK